MRFLWCMIIALSFVELLVAEEVGSSIKDSPVNDAPADPVGDSQPSEPVVSAAPIGPVNDDDASAEPNSNIEPAQPIINAAPTAPVINSAAAPAVLVTSAAPSEPIFNAAPEGQEYSFSIRLDKAEKNHLVNVQHAPQIHNDDFSEPAERDPNEGEEVERDGFVRTQYYKHQPYTYSAGAVPEPYANNEYYSPQITRFQEGIVQSQVPLYQHPSAYYQPSSPANPIYAFRIYSDNSHQYNPQNIQFVRASPSGSSQYQNSIVHEQGSYLLPSSQAGHYQSYRAANSYPSTTTYSVSAENSGHLFNSEENKQVNDKFVGDFPANHKLSNDEVISKRSDSAQQISAKYSPNVPLTYENLKPEEYQNIVNGINNKQSFRYSPSSEISSESSRYSKVSQTPANTYYSPPTGNSKISKIVQSYYAPQAEYSTYVNSPAQIYNTPSSGYISKSIYGPSAAYTVTSNNPAYPSLIARHSAIVQSPVKSYYSSPAGYQAIVQKSFNKYYTPPDTYSEQYSIKSDAPTISYYTPSTARSSIGQKSVNTFYSSPIEYSSKVESPADSYYQSSASNYKASSGAPSATYGRAGYQGYNVFPNDPYNTAAAAPAAPESSISQDIQKVYSEKTEQSPVVSVAHESVPGVQEYSIYKNSQNVYPNSPAASFVQKSIQSASTQVHPSLTYKSAGYQGYNVFPHDPYSKIDQQIYKQYSPASPVFQYSSSDESQSVNSGRTQYSPAAQIFQKSAQISSSQSSPAVGYNSVGYQGYNVFPHDPYSKLNKQVYQQYSPASPAVGYSSVGYQGYNVFPNDPYSKVDQQVYQQYSPAAPSGYGYVGAKESQNVYYSQPQYSPVTLQYQRVAYPLAAQHSPASVNEGHYGYNVIPNDPYSKLSQQVYQEYSPAVPVAHEYTESGEAQSVYPGYYQYASPSVGYYKVAGPGSIQYSRSPATVNEYTGHYGYNVFPYDPYPQYSPAAPGSLGYSESGVDESSQSENFVSHPVVHPPAIYSPAAQSFGSEFSQKQTKKLQPIVAADQGSLSPEAAQQIVDSPSLIPPKGAEFYKPCSEGKTQEKAITPEVAIQK